MVDVVLLWLGRLGRAFFEIQELTLLEMAMILSVALLWALVLCFIWRWHLLERVTGLVSRKT